jgi:hypothetical protein
LAARYWGYAAQCLIVAQRQDAVGDKLALINMAQAWVTLAEQTERAEQTEKDASQPETYNMPAPPSPDERR